MTVNDVSVPSNNNVDNEIAMGFFIQQSLPRLTIPVFSGSPLVWIEFVTRFKDLIHDQPYLTILRKSTLLLQHLEGEAKRSVQGYPNDANGYVLSLKRLKFLFGQKNKIAQAFLMRVTQGKEIQDDDENALSELYYSISDCLVTLKQLNYASDMYSSDTLRQVVLRLPQRMRNKWGDAQLRIRSNGQDPSLVEFEAWLQTRVLARREICQSVKPQRRGKDDERSTKDEEKKNRNTKYAARTDVQSIICTFCQGSHLFWKCATYDKMNDTERFNYAKKKKLCYNCLRAKHVTKDCSSKISCSTSGCSDRHHSTLHGFFSSVKEKDAAQEDEGDKDVESADGPPNQKVNSLMVKTTVVGSEDADSDEVLHSLMVKSKVRDVFMCVVPVTIRSLEGVPHDTYALLDNACTNSVMIDTVIDRLHTQAETQTAEVGTIKDDPECINVRETTVFVESRDASFKFELENIVAVPPERFKMPSQPSPPPSKEPDIYTHLDDIELNGVHPSQIEILIGADVAEAFIPREVRRGRKDQPLAIKTVFGWTLFGADRGVTNSDNLKVCLSSLHRTSTHVNKLWINHGTTKKLSINTTYVRSPHKHTLEALVERFWIQEHTGILPSRDVAMSVEDVSALKRLKTETKLVNGRYVVPLLWLDAAMKLPNNISLAQKRWKFLKRRFKSDPVLYAKYKKIIHDYIRDGKARRMSPEEVSRTSDKTSYVPHHPVWNPHKPDKIRIVNDAAAEYGGMSLNRSLVTRPDLLNSLVGVLMRFRVGPVALVADIEAMFHQVYVPEAAADAQRFLWSDDKESDDPPCTMQMLVHMFGAKDSLTYAIHALQQTARDNAAYFSATTIETILCAFYVDDLLKSMHSEDAAKQLAKELMETLKRGGF